MQDCYTYLYTNVLPLLSIFHNVNKKGQSRFTEVILLYIAGTLNPKPREVLSGSSTTAFKDDVGTRVSWQI